MSGVAHFQHQNLLRDGPIWLTKQARKVIESKGDTLIDVNEDSIADGYDSEGPKALLYTLYVVTLSEGVYTYQTYYMEEWYDDPDLAYALEDEMSSPALVLINEKQLDFGVKTHENIFQILLALSKEPANWKELSGFLASSWHLDAVRSVLSCAKIVTPWAGEF